MTVKTFEINGVAVVRADGTIDWDKVYNVPVVNNTDNNHTHGDRYYTIAEVLSRISSATDAIDDLIEKVDLLNETTGILLSSSDATVFAPSANTSFTTGYTISFGVVYQTSLVPTIFFNKENSYEIQVSPDGWLSYATAGTGVSSWAWIWTGIQVPPNERHKVTMCYDGPGARIHIYLDGGLAYDSAVHGTFSGTAETPSTTVNVIPSSLLQVSDPLRFGLRGNNGQSLLNGKFDTILCYNRFLAKEDVKKVLSAQEGKLPAVAGLVLYYDFEGITPLADKSGNGITASTLGTVSYVVL